MSSQSGKRSVHKPRPVSGFPEWLPAEQILYQRWIDAARATFESHGFVGIETPSVEELDVLLAKGETDKEIYVLQRLQADPDDRSDARLGLHYDLTVPLARYVAQHFGELVFPFKRYQIQRAWRGERPQEGRFREFYQCDIDVIGQDELPLIFDAELPAMAWQAVARMGVEGVRLHISNRKVLGGFLHGLDIADPVPVIRTVDKRDKIGADGVADILADQHGLAASQIDAIARFSAIQSEDGGFREAVKAIGITHPVLEAGLEELATVRDGLSGLPRGAVLVDLSIARGFDYYTGTVYEGRLTGYPGFGSVVSGGRYDDLAGSFINRRLPGVGISIGLTRLFSKLLGEGVLRPGPASPAAVLMVVPSDDRLDLARNTAERLRRRGIAVETYHAAAKLKRQLAYAERKGIPHVWFPPFEDGAPHEVKDMASGSQGSADPDRWSPGA